MFSVMTSQRSIPARGSMRMLLAALFVAMGSSAAAFGQVAPPVGPDSYRTDTRQIGVGILTGTVRTTLDKIITDANTALQQRGTSVRVSLKLPLTFYSPRRVASELKSRPNEYYVLLPMNVGIHVSIPYAADRDVYYPLDINVTCDKWYLGEGNIKVAAVPGPPSVEGGNFIEDLFFVRDYITAQVRNNLPRIAAVAQAIPNAKCVTIGASPSNGSPDPFAFIAWDEPKKRIRVPVAALGQLQVTFDRLKRLAARGNGSLLYQATENTRLNLYGNFEARQTPVMTMTEGTDVALNLPPIVFNQGMPNILVIIANAEQSTGINDDTGFTSALRTANYSPGTHMLVIPKHYVIPPGPGHTKPIIATTPAYELTYTVTVTTPTVLSPRAGVQ
ncbi:MAG: hypothetical protein ABIP75_08700 [Pyrinomonadaceae bacterium]